MKAVNLIPRDARPKRGALPSSGTGVYVLLAGLAAIVVCAAVWAMADKQVADREAKLQRVTAQASAAQARAGAGAAYVAFERLARERVQTVKSLSTTRFDWAHAMREISRVLPADVWLTTLTGASGASSEAPTPATSAAPAPTVTVSGCTRSQAKVARLMARLRTIDGVRKISLKSSDKPAAGGDATCPANRASDPHFTITTAFAIPGAPRDGVDESGRITPSQPGSASAGVSGANDRNAAAMAAATNGEGGS
ncbi:MAG TPA: PilN domain-containing protein [Solirubrobacteraceae bacterium]|jgi:Tfp pilus assembly protein PilN|nr:PilN domain-containing protein [Solirubrobacteraceae bacterium]